MNDEKMEEGPCCASCRSPAEPGDSLCASCAEKFNKLACVFEGRDYEETEK